MLTPIEDKSPPTHPHTALEVPPGNLEGRQVNLRCSVDMCAQLNRWMPLIVGLIIGAAICAVSLYGGIKKHDWVISAAGISFGCFVVCFSVLYQIYCVK